MSEQAKKRRKGLSSKDLTIKFFRKKGYRVADVERCIRRPAWPGGPAYAVRFDAWGFADAVAFKVGSPGMTALQASTWSNFWSHLKKISLLAHAYEFLISTPGNRIGLMCWRRNPKKGEKPVHVYNFRWLTPETFTQLPEGSHCEVTLKTRKAKKERRDGHERTTSVPSRDQGGSGQAAGAQYRRRARRYESPPTANGDLAQEQHRHAAEADCDPETMRRLRRSYDVCPPPEQ